MSIDLTDAHRKGVLRAFTLRPFIIAGIVACFSYLAIFSYQLSVNWDEFFYLSKIYAFQAGWLNRPLQHFHVHLFGFLTRVPDSEFDQISAARVLMIGFLGLSSISTYRIARIFVDHEAALVGVLAFLTSGYVLGHGSSFRADPIAAGLLMTGLAILMVSSLRWYEIAVSAVCCAVAVLVTVKSVFFLPAFLAALLWRTGASGCAARVCLSGILAVVLAGMLYLWHASTLAPDAAVSGMQAMAGSAQKTLFSAGFWPRKLHTLTWVTLSIGPIFLVMMGILSPTSGKRRLVFLLLILPLGSILFYRNAFPYFFPFIVPPVMVVAAVGAERLSRTMRGATVILLLASATFQANVALRENNEAQRATLDEVHRLFPGPVAYIDRNGMVPSFRKVGFFMSTWGIESYLDHGKPVFERQIVENAPPLLLANSPALSLALGERSGLLLEEDAVVLRETYLHHWGPIWLAGMTLSPEGGEIVVRVPGSYRLQANGSVVVLGQELPPGGVVKLDAGRYQVSSAGGEKAALIWDTGLEAPKRPFPNAPLYYGFWSLW